MNLFNKKQKTRDDEGKEIATVSTALQKGIDEYIQPLATCDSLILHCPNCDKIHFRHAGYIETAMPYINDSGDGKIINNSHPVKVCINCKKSYATIGDKMYDVSDDMDLNAWENTEKELHKATGPGGQC